MKTGIGSHTRAFRGKTDCWLTPPEIIKALGPFDLDPCAAPGQPWTTAEHQYAPPQDGLELPWFGRAICGSTRYVVHNITSVMRS